MKRWVIGAVVLAILLIGGYIVAGFVVRKKIESALQHLPPGLNVSWSALHLHLLTASWTIDSLHVRWAPSPDTSHAQQVSIQRLQISGIRYGPLLHQRLNARTVRIEGCDIDVDRRLLEKKDSLPHLQLPFTELGIGRVEFAGLRIRSGKGGDPPERDGRAEKGLSLEGEGEFDSISEGEGKWRFGDVHFTAAHIRYVIPGADEIMHVAGARFDSKQRQLRIDTVRIRPTGDREAIGRAKGHQTDIVTATSEGIGVEGLNILALSQRRLEADKIAIRKNDIHVFRDRRLPLVPGNKPLPMEGLERMPVSLRVGSVSLGSTFFTYEEYPKKGNETGLLKIYRLHGTLEPLINHPRAGDPAYLTMRMEGSLMNSGTVNATTKMPLHRGDPYKVEGVFHDLDVTTLNGPAENLGRLHLESGMLNSLDFEFNMTDEASTGRIIGEYHDLVVDKLKENTDEKKIAKFKSFALKTFIIPKNKDKSLPVRKRTGKVKYKRDPQRYFSYYLLHSLLVGVKSSFTLGFLLPG